MAAQLDLATFTQPPSTWQDQLVNQLAAAAMAVEPALAERYRQLSDLLPAPVCVTGSGSAMFMLADTQADARNALQCLPDDLRQRTHLVHSLDPPAAD